MLSRDRLASQRGVHSTAHGMIYNELVIDGYFSNRRLPESIEAFVATRGDDLEVVRRTHRRFLREYGLKAHDCPLLVYHPGEGFGCLDC